MINTESHFCAYNNLRSAKSVWRDSKQRLSWILYGQMDTEMVDKGPAYLTYMQSTSCEMPAWINHKLKSRLPGEISITSDMQIILPNGRK